MPSASNPAAIINAATKLKKLREVSAIGAVREFLEDVLAAAGEVRRVLNGEAGFVLNDSVGVQGKNNPDDVRAVQLALSQRAQQQAEGDSERKGPTLF